MMDTTNYESLEGKFGIANIDVQNRTNSGIYGYGKIYITKEHFVGIQQCMADNPHLKNRMSFLSFINSNGRIICFVDCLALFQKIPYNEVVEVVVDQCQEPPVAEIYEYKYPNEIKLLYKAMPLEA